MIYLTGDLHGEIDMHKLTMQAFPEQKEMTRDDYVIICGDFGCVWDGSKRDQYLLKELSQRNFTTLFVDGNHENFPLLNSYPVTQWHGGNVHEVAPHVRHLMRGQVFEIGGLQFFTMGGASSHDKMYRTEGKSWWPEELPSNEECYAALDTLDKHGWEVDYVITHCAPDSVQEKLADWYEHDRLTNFLEVVKSKLTYREWICGHYHEDKRVDAKHVALYRQIVELETAR